jgi:hypothetical protein
MSLHTTLDRQTIDLIKPDSRWLIVCRDTWGARQTLHDLRTARTVKSWVRDNPWSLHYDDGAFVRFRPATSSYDQFQGNRFDGIVLHECSVPHELYRLLEMSTDQTEASMRNLIEEPDDEKLKSEFVVMKRLLAHFIAKEGGEVRIPMRSVHSFRDAENVEVHTDFINRFIYLRCDHRIPKPTEPQYEEFLMGADLLEERGMDRAAQALRAMAKLHVDAARMLLESRGLTPPSQFDRA